jgi:hypothetical protein
MAKVRTTQLAWQASVIVVSVAVAVITIRLFGGLGDTTGTAIPKQETKVAAPAPAPAAAPARTAAPAPAPTATPAPAPTAAPAAAPPARPATGFDAWQFTGVTGQANAAKAPDGTNTAYKLSEDPGGGAKAIEAIINLDPAKLITASLSARSGTGRRLLVYLAADEDRIACDLDLQSGHATLRMAGASQSGACNAKAQGEGWWRLELQGVVNPQGSSAVTVLGIALAKEPFEQSYEGDGSGSLLIWNAAASAPRTGFDTWRFTGAAGQANAARAPDGSNNAYKLSEQPGGGSKSIEATINLDPAKSIGASLSARSENGRRLLVYLATDDNRITCDVDLESGKATLRTTGAAHSGTCNAKPQKEGWWRIELQGILTSPGGSGVTVLGIALAREPFEQSYEADGTGSVLIWNAAASPASPRR